MNRNQLLTVLNGIMEWVPEELYRGRITLIPKVNNPQDFGDFRPICVMPLVARILHRILAKRLSVVEHHRFQAGFTENRSTSENVWLLSAIMGSAGSRCSSTYLALLDFQKAFDSVSHRTMVGLLYDLGLPPKLGGIYPLYTPVRDSPWVTAGSSREGGFFRGIPYPPSCLT